MGKTSIEIETTDSEASFRKTTGFNGYLGLYFSEQYKSYMILHRKANKNYYLMYSDGYVVPVLIRNYFVFHYATLLDAPVEYGKSCFGQQTFLNTVCTYLKNKLSVQWIVHTPIDVLFDTYPLGAKTIRFANTAIRLNRTEEEVFSSLGKNFRKAVRRAEKWDVSCAIGGKELIADFAEMETATWKRSDVPLDHTSDSFYEDLFNCMGENIVVGISYKDGKPQSGLVCYFDDKICYAQLGAHFEDMEGGSNNLLHWSMIKWCIEHCIEKYVLVGYRLKVDEGSKIAKIQEFKDSFNGEHEEGFMFKLEMNKPMIKLYELIIKMNEVLHGKKISKQQKLDIIDQEIQKWPEYNR